MIQPIMRVPVTANVHSMAPQAGNLLHRHVQFTGKSYLVRGHVLGKKPPHDFRPDRLGKLALEEPLEFRYFGRVIAMFPGYRAEILFPALERMFRTKRCQGGENLIEQGSSIR